MVSIPFPTSDHVIPQHLFVQLWYISDSIMSLFWEPTIRKQEKVTYFFLLPECLMILIPELLYHKVGMVPAAAYGLEWGEGAGHLGSQTLGQPLGQPQHPFLLLEGKRSHGKQSPGASFGFSLLKSVFLAWPELQLLHSSEAAAACAWSRWEA